MKIPSKLKVGGHIYSVNLVDPDDIQKDCGECAVDKLEIKNLRTQHGYTPSDEVILELCTQWLSLTKRDSDSILIDYPDDFIRKMRLTGLISVRGGGEISIFQEDTNVLAKEIKADVVYVDPPYNSRQYSRFYHVLETLTKWDKPKLHGVALKPDPENMSDYCRVNAKDKLAELVKDIDAKFLVVSYNNTYDSKSNSSKNKITLQEIEKILQAKGKTKVFEKDYRHFNAGNTNFNNHKEYLFVTNCQHDS